VTTPINLNKARKAKARDEKKARADANTVAFGQSKAARAQAKALQDRAAKRLSDKKLDP